MADLSNECLAAWVLHTLPDAEARDVQHSAERDPALASKLLSMQLMCGVPPSPVLLAAAHLEPAEFHEPAGIPRGLEQPGQARPGDAGRVSPAAVRSLIAELLERELQNRETLLLRNRDVIEECRDQLLAEAEATPGQLRDFYETAAVAMAEALADQARSALAGERGNPPQPVAGETLRIASDETSLALSATQPDCVLRRAERLLELAEFARDDAAVYRLSMFAGRTVEEVAVLLSRATPDVEQSLAAAVTEVHLDDDQPTRNQHDS